MSTALKILESMNRVFESALTPPNSDNSTPTGKKNGDYIKVIEESKLRRLDKLTVNSIWMVDKTPRDTYVDMKGNTVNYTYYTLNKINIVTGKITTSKVNRMNFSGFDMITEVDLDVGLQSGQLKVLTPNKPFNYGEVTPEDIISVLTNIGALRLYKGQLNNIVDDKASRSTIYFYPRIFFTEVFSKTLGNLMYQNFLKAIKKRRWTYKVTYNDTISIDKIPKKN